MPLLSTLVDSFNDGVLGPEWGNSYGGTTETGGRARVPCTTGYAGCQTGYAWTLAGASFFVQVPTTPDPTGATAEAYAAITVQGTVEGTRVGFIINKVSGMLRCVSETGYWDDDAVEITYDPVAHLFLRLAEDGTDLTWSTSPDGTTWTTRRTLATPAWIPADAELCALDMSAHRDGGTPDVAEFDYFNTLSDAGVWDVSATLTATAALDVGAPTVSARTSATLTGTAGLDAAAGVSAQLSATLTAESTLTAHAGAAPIPEVAELSAGDWDLYIEQGATFLQRFTVDDDPDFTWDGWEARSQIRSEASANGELLLDLTDYLTVDGAEIRIAIPASVTETLTRNGRWDLEVANGATVVRLLNGRAIVSPEVTR
ncbi:hypothetical protein [Streptomyces massasporeus]|uniref:hypothetical protein n=1 Tax=Streptomyces massasporeus TaxID=67324 RepID=UPI00167A0746|nr:hypothetical protein [Streptomyces massasporeus]GGV91638.1 hypothetical protein GCM10010228_82510 [Streptomyces massasporeus]